MLCIKTGVVATVDNTRLRGDAFVLPAHSFAAEALSLRYLHPTRLDTVENSWCLLNTVAERTAVEDWLDFGPVDHILADGWDHRFSRGPDQAIILLAPGQWSWLGYDGEPTKL